MLTMPMAAAYKHLSLTDVLHPKSKTLWCQNHSRHQWWLLQRDVVIQHEGSITTLELMCWKDRATKAEDFGHAATKLDGISFCLDKAQAKLSTPFLRDQDTWKCTLHTKLLIKDGKHLGKHLGIPFRHKASCVTFVPHLHEERAMF